MDMVLSGRAATGGGSDSDRCDCLELDGAGGGLAATTLYISLSSSGVDGEVTEELARNDGLHMANVLLGGEKYSFRGDWHGDPIVLPNPPLDADVVELEGVTAVVAVPADRTCIFSVSEPVLEDVSVDQRRTNR